MTRLLLIVLSMVIFSLLPAQSFFSMRGLGEEIINTDAVTTSLGSAISLSYQNPSYPIKKENTIFEATVIGSGIYGDDANHHRFISNVRPNYLKGLFVLPFGFGFGLGLAERFNQNFDVYSDSQLGYQRHVVGYGGIYSIGVSISKSFYDYVGLGFEYNRNFGDAQERWFFETSTGSNITTDTVATNYRGDLLKFGLSSHIWIFNLGVLYEKNLPIYIDSRVLSHGVVTDSISNLKFQIPARIGFGISFNPINKLLISLDYFHRNTKNIKIADTNSMIYRNCNKYSIGFEYNLNNRNPLRIGYRYYDWYFVDQSSKIINEQAITIGIGIPIPKFGSFNLALELINRKGSSISEKICRLNITLHYEETWKIRKRRWGY